MLILLSLFINIIFKGFGLSFLMNYHLFRWNGELLYIYISNNSIDGNTYPYPTQTRTRSKNTLSSREEEIH